MSEETTTDIVTVPVSQQVQAAYKHLEQQLVELEADNDKLAFNYADVQGQVQVRSHIHMLRGYKGGIESTRKELKSGALEYGRVVDSTAKELTARMEAMIQHHKEPLDQIIAEEEVRQGDIQYAINKIEEFRQCLFGFGTTILTAAACQRAMDGLNEIEIDAGTFQERMAEATILKNTELEELGKLHATTLKSEQDAAELERLKAEEAARLQAERDKRIALEAAEKAKLEAEAHAAAEAAKVKEAAEEARREVEAEAEAERQALAKRAADAEIARKEERAEAQRKLDEAEGAAERAREEAEEAKVLAADRAADAKKEADRLLREAGEKVAREESARKAEQEKREADKRHVLKINTEASAAIAAIIEKGMFNLATPEQVAEAIVGDIIIGNIPHVSIKY
tara:strand:+ start:2171 stop:3364 length:1194 start_codon:yes stop_codon:yes gene_type:complete